MIRRLFACLVLLAAAAPLASGADDGPPKVEVSVLEPEIGERFIWGVETSVRVKVDVPEGAEPPRRVDADFSRGDASAGQFSSRPADLTRNDDGSYGCLIRVIFPKSPGEYTLKVSARGKRPRPGDPSKTLAVKPFGSDAWEIAEAPKDADEPPARP